MISDTDLLKTEIETLWSTDARGRLLGDRQPWGRAAPYLVIACGGGRRVVALSSDVPDALADELLSIAHASAPPADPSSPPSSLARCEQLLTHALGSVEVSSGPGYWIPPGTAFTSSAQIRRWRDEGVDALREHTPDGANWQLDEWQQLIDGKLGPWAFAIIDERVIAICHSAALTERGAEAGVWTHRDHRGQGHAAAVTASWASLFSAGKRQLFYSTSATNFSSQRVAARLNLRPIGWMWKLGPARGG